MIERKINIQQPPSNIESEKALLGSMLLHNEIIKKCELIVKPEAFYLDKHKIICYAIFDLKHRDIAIDILTLSDRLKAGKKLDEIGGLSYLTELVNCIPSGINAEHYAKIVRTKFKARKILEDAEKIQKSINYDENDIGVKSLIKRLYDNLKEEDNSEDQKVRLMEAMKIFDGDDKVIGFSEIYKNITEKKDTTPNVSTGHINLDKILKRMKPRQLIVLSGITKHGKTSFAIDLTIKMKDWNPLWLPIEESAEELMEKFLDRNEQPPHGYSPQNISSVNTNWIEQKIAEGYIKYGSKVVFIDNLDWVEPSKSHQTDGEHKRVQQTVMELKALAKKWNVLIFLLVHLNKNSKSVKNPTFDDLKGSSGIGQICDKAILIWRETKEGDDGELEITNNTNISVQLNRQGGVGNVKMIYENGHYREFDWKKEQDNASFGDYANNPQQSF